MSTSNILTIDQRRLVKNNFGKTADRRGSLWLDSSYSLNDRGHKSFVARNPVTELSLHSNRLVIDRGDKKIERPGDIFDFLSELERFTEDGKFAAGYFSYESTLPFVGIDAPETASACFFVYDSHLTIDYRTNECTSSDPEIDDYADLFDHAANDEDIKDARAAMVRAGMTKAEYLAKVKQVLYHIHEGDIYQANLTTAFEVESSLRPYDVYRRLRQLNPAPYGAFMNCSERQIISSSPERMFYKEGDYVTSGPIKGTIANSSDPNERERNLRQLLDSSKDRAELLMIVDLIRNDLGKVARPGSVKVTNLHKPEVYSSVIHLVGDVECHLRPNLPFRELTVALLPGGSITGAPKKRAVEILQQLETVPRSVYTGCIGYLYGDSADFNIAIRTIEHINDKYYVHAGGGIVADSDPESEYNEMQLKARNLFRALGVAQS